MKRRFLPVLVFGALAVVIVTVTLAFWPKHRITRANFDKIQIGMSQAELRGLLGPPRIVDEFELGQVRGEEYVWVDNGRLLLIYQDGNQSWSTCLDDNNYRYLSKDDLRRMGFQDYQQQVWISSEIRICSNFR